MFQILLVIIYISFISLGLPDSLLGSAWPSMYEGLKVPISYAGIISMIISGCTIISSLLCDRIVRKLGTGLLTALSVLMTAIALLGFSTSHSFIALCLWAIPYGLGAGSVDVALNNFVALHYKAKHMSWLHCFWGIGATLGPYIMGAALTRNLEWNFGYRAIFFIQIVLSGLLLLSLPLWKKSNGKTESGEEEAPTDKKLIELISLPGAKQILIAFLSYCALEQITGVWASSYLVLQKGISAKSAASLLGMFYLGITAGRFLSGFLTYKLNSKNLIRLGQGIALFGVILFFLSSHTVLISSGLICIGLGCAPIYPSLLHQTPERFGKAASQAMMGLQMACAYVGSTFSPPVIGFLTTKISISIYPVFQLAFVLIMIVMVETCNRHKIR